MIRQTERAIGPIGTAARVLVGAGLLLLAFLGPWELWWWPAVVGLVGVPVAVLGLQALRLRLTRDPLCSTGCSDAGTWLTVGAGIALWILAPAAFLLFFGATMLVSALRGYGGCEVLAVSNWILRRNDQVFCLLFSPIDRAEASVGADRRPT